MQSRNNQIHMEAAEWFVELDAGDDFHQRQAFDAWLRRSPEHVQAFLELLPVWEQSGVKRAHALDPEDLIARALGGKAEVVPLPVSGDGPPRQPRVRPGAYAVAASVLLIAAALLWWQQWNGSVYSTGIGELRSVVLADGTAVDLNARSRVRVRFTERERRVDLLEGQALFNVRRESARPFVVHSETAYVHVLGTKFDVNRRRRGTTVSVLEGRVSVSPHDEARRLYLAAGEQVVATAGELTEVHPSSLAAATAWTQRQLMFQKTALIDVVEEFNRYNARQMRIRDTRLEDFLVSGTFVSTDPASFLRFLGEQPGVRVTALAREILIGVQ